VAEVGVDGAGGLALGLERRPRDAGALPVRPEGLALGGRRGEARLDARLEARGGEGLVDEAPLLGALPLDALGEAREDVGEVATHVALVDDAREPARPRQHAEERHLGEADRRVAVVLEEDLVARGGELVAPARARAAHGADGLDARRRGGVLEGEPRLVRELAEVHLERVRRRAEHEDVGARAEDAVLPARDEEGADLGVLEAQPLDRVGELEVDAEVVRVELQLVAGPHPAVLLDVHREAGDVALDLQPPVAVPVGRGLEADGGVGLRRVLGRRRAHGSRLLGT
jgi:hypothetical protein